MIRGWCPAMILPLHPDVRSFSRVEMLTKAEVVYGVLKQSPEVPNCLLPCVSFGSALLYSPHTTSQLSPCGQFALVAQEQQLQSWFPARCPSCPFKRLGYARDNAMVSSTMDLHTCRLVIRPTQ